MELFAFDDDYVRRLREGDRETESHFHSYFGDLLFLKLRRCLRNPQAIDDLRQEVFVRVLERLPDLRDGRKLGAFVNGTCRLVLLEYFRAGSRTVALGEEHNEIADPSDDPGARLDAARDKVRVRKVITGLPEREKEILMAICKGVDKDRICATLGVDRDYLRVLLHRAKIRFRQDYLRRRSGRLSIHETFGPRTTLPT